MKAKVFLLLSLIALLSVACIKDPYLNHKDNPAQLQITVVDVTNVNIEGATITLYGTEQDLKDKTNPLMEAISDKDGNVIFKELETKIYYFYAQKEDMNNETSFTVLNEVLELNKKATIKIIIK